MVTISICMIVKNEEAILARCLDSLQGLAEELIIVDTGSTDKTKEIAHQYTDLVYDYPWHHHYSDARNFSFEKATQDYIYIADADEILDEENREKFLVLKEILLPEIEIVQMQYANQLEHNTVYNFDCELRPKLFKRLRPFTWQNPIHETVRLDPVVYDSDIVILHRPQVLHAGRDFYDYRYNIAQGPLSPETFIMYARELYIAGTDQDFLDAEEYFTNEMNEAPRSLDELLVAQCVVAHAARLRSDGDALMKAALKQFAIGTPSAELCCELGEYFLAKGDQAEAMMWFSNALEETESILTIQSSTEWPEKRLKEQESLPE